jgi:NSS family neurotransmitter:Na+ symporter
MGKVVVVRVRQFLHNLANFRTAGSRMAESVTQAGSRTSQHGQWSSRLAFILAVTGSAVGLGNIWKFPYMAGENGGGAFVLVYLVCVFAIGLPIMMSEILLGRRGRRSPVGTMRILGQEEAEQPAWQLVGVVGVAAGFLILSFYSVIAGWTMAYFVKAVRGDFQGLGPEQASEVFSALTSSSGTNSVWHTVFMFVTIAVVARGVERGLEQAVRVMVPALFVLLLALLAYAVTSGDFSAGLEFMFRPDFSKVTGTTILAAMGQAFFTLSIGMGAVMAYGAYLPQETSIIRTSLAVVTADTAIAVLAGLVIFPIVFANGLDPAEGPGLIFQTLPLAFGQMPGGSFFGALFFVLLAFAALTSAISLIEPAIAWLMESRGITRMQAALSAGIVVWLLGFLTVFSFSGLADFKFLQGTFFDNFDYLTSNVMLPLGGLFITVFAGWVMCQNSSADELGGAGTTFRVWLFLARYVAPVAVVLVFLNAVGVFS